MKRVLYLCLFLFLTAGCNQKVIEKPEDLIAKDKMVDILFDLAIINAGKAIDPNVMKENQIEPMSYIYTKYEIDSAQFVKSDLYYASIPQEYETIYKALEERLEEEKTRLEGGKQKEQDTTANKKPIKLPVNSME